AHALDAIAKAQQKIRDTLMCLSPGGGHQTRRSELQLEQPCKAGSASLVRRLAHLVTCTWARSREKNSE
ncbi:hypothetical protein RSW49_24115, partial [Escherichia coli]|uniref:hypothetical protein n=1 Tax=Escherichia coli TaxID=562 RepID=UPI0028DEE1CE